MLDAQGNRIPSYDQRTITNFARVFTGWDLDANLVLSVDGTTAVTNYQRSDGAQQQPEPRRSQSKTLLTDINHATPVIVPACDELHRLFSRRNCANNSRTRRPTPSPRSSTAIDNLFNHPNTGPFVCIQMIHQLVTSNPSPAYVGRCSAAFANNGAGVRGDMKAVITTILLDPEARGDVKNDPNYGHLREPVLLMTSLLRAFNATDAQQDRRRARIQQSQQFKQRSGSEYFQSSNRLQLFSGGFQPAGDEFVWSGVRHSRHIDELCAG